MVTYVTEQASLLAISDLSPLVDIKKAIRLGVDAGLKNFQGAFVSMYLCVGMWRGSSERLVLP